MLNSACCLLRTQYSRAVEDFVEVYDSGTVDVLSDVRNGDVAFGYV